MGSQWAPILCSAVALMREYNFFQVYPMLTIELIRRFSDSPGNNKVFLRFAPFRGHCVCVNRYSKQFSFDESIMFWRSRENIVMQIEPKLVGTCSVKSSATTQAHSAIPELRISTCQCTCAIIYSWRWDGITNEVLAERLYRTVLCIVFILNSNVQHLHTQFL